MEDGLNDAFNPEVERTVSEQRPLLEVEGLRVEFKARNGIARVIDDLHLSVMPGETLGVVGESGCGKSMTALSIMGLVPMPPGRIAAGEDHARRRGSAAG